jgi:hypothetical protein
MTLIDLAKRAEKLLRDNSPVVLTALGVSGTLTTAFLAGRASYNAAALILREETKTEVYFSTKEKVHFVWKLYIPASISAVVTVGSIISASRIGSRRTAALTAAYSLSERALIEYKDKVVETLGVKKEKTMRDAIAQDSVTKNPPTGVIVTGSGTVLCCDLFTGRYFSCDMESLRKAENMINKKMIQHMEATISDFYDLVGLSHTSYSSVVGWTSDKMLELSFSTVMSEDSRPCIAFEFNYTKPL